MPLITLRGEVSGVIAGPRPTAGKGASVLAEILDLSGWDSVFEEPSGETDKQWLRDPETGLRWLYKPNKVDRSADEASSEFSASLIAKLFEIPAATVRLGVRDDRLGCISLNVVSSETHGLIDAATLLGALESDFDPKDKFSRGHSPTNIVSILADLDPPSGCLAGDRAEDVFADYLLFDAFIGNTDRHSKNWAIETRLVGRDLLSKTFDHATSLGVTTRGTARERLIADPLTIRGFAEKATARRFEGGRNMSLVDYGVGFVTCHARERIPTWVDRLESIKMDDIHDAIASSEMSPEAASLATSITTINRERILQCLKLS